MKNEITLTYQTRLKLDERSEEVLQECASMFSRVERSLYAEIAKGKKAASCKNRFLKTYKITARQFNACRVSLEGKIAACQAIQAQSLLSLKQQINTLEQKIKLLERKPSKRLILHQKKRRKNALANRLTLKEEDLKTGRVHLCFGSKKLFHAQFHLEKNGFNSLQEWKTAWTTKRESEFFVLGSKDETGGNQTCTAKLQNDGRLHLRLRLPDTLVDKHGKYLEIENITFVHGYEAILASLNDIEGRALSYRFKKDAKSWKVFVSTDLTKPSPVTREDNGVIGIDLNADHIAYVETDRFGNPISNQTLSWISYGKTKGQLKAITGDICKQIVDKAKETKKPLIIENLDFHKKKLALREKGNCKFARLLSSFAYGLFQQFLITRAYKHGIVVHRINPAFTSVIGRVKYAKRYGLSTHLAAALCIARRHQKFSETPCSSEGKIPDGKGGHLAFVLPARNRTKHVWHFWGQVKKKIATVLAAHFRAIRNRSLSPHSSTLEIGNSRLLLV
jgi:IS605 OrfB family transposase